MSATLLQSHYFDAKGIMPVIQAVRIVYQQIPDDSEFYGSEIHAEVKKLTGRPGLFAESVIRKLRLMRENGEANFVCLDQIDSKYKKIS
jgi:hypothetical protein